MTSTNRTLARLTVAAEERLVVPIRDFVSQLLAGHGLSGQQLAGLDLLVEEACLHVVQTSFDPGEEGEFDISVQRRPNQVAIVLEDRGLPGSPEEAARQGPGQLGLALMRAYADEVVFSNLGKGGKRLELIKTLAPGAVSAEVAREPRPPEAAPPATDEVSLRLMVASDAASLARCMYRCYGYTYLNEAVYFPDRIAELLAGGLLASCVAVNEAGEVVGHLGLQFDRPGAKVAESGVAVVDPRYRGRKIFERMKAFMAEWAAGRGMYGLFSSAVSSHPISQKGNVALGAAETGVVLGYLPPGLQFRSIKDEAGARRESVVMFFMKTAEAPPREVFPPAHHAAMIARIHDRVGVARRALEAPADLTLGAVRDRRSALTLSVKPELGLALIRIESYGFDVLEAVHGHLRELCQRKVACTELSLPLGDPLTAVLCRAFEGMGFAFAGVGVEAGEGDSLLLVHLDGVEVDPAALVTVSDHGRALADYALAAAREAASRR